jgi:pSer/pThr/pTyr-binding forkhead associated (FHA) protein
MSQPVVLLIIRLVSALALLAFLGYIAWLMAQDLKLAGAQRQVGAGGTATLTILNGEAEAVGNGVEIPLLPLTTIGRAASNTVVIDDDYSSSEHALISLRGRQWWLEDLGSKNGTLLNDLPLEGATVVSTGDVITIGRTRLKVAVTARAAT